MTDGPDFEALDKSLIADLLFENKQLKAALAEIVGLDHYPDATIARRALGLPTTERKR